MVVLSACWVRPTRDGGYLPRLNADAMFVVRSLEELAFDNPSLFREHVMRQPHSIFDSGLYAAATNALPHATGYRGEDFRVFPSGLDPWGIPLWIKLVLVRTSTDLSGRKAEVFQMKVWSSGPNKRNEQGSGDDILYGPFEVQTR